MNAPYALRYLPSSSKNGGEVKHLLPHSFYENGYISYGDRDHTFDLFDSIVKLEGHWKGEKLEWVEVTYGGALKTPDEQGIFTKIDGGQRVKRWQRGQGVTPIWDPEPAPIPTPEMPEPDAIIIESDTFGNSFMVQNSGSANVVIDGNLLVNGTITVAPPAEPVTRAVPTLEELENMTMEERANLLGPIPREVLQYRLEVLHKIMTLPDDECEAYIESIRQQEAPAVAEVDAENVEVSEDVDVDEESATN